jgi:predicted MFS family arabinose efflux permease
MFGATIYLPVFLQAVLGASATNSGLLLLPLVGGMLVTSAVTGQLMTRLGQYKPFTVLGTLCAAVGFWLLHTMGPSTPHTMSTAFMFVTGMGLGFVMPTLTVAAQNVVDRTNLGVATTSVTFSRSLGSSVGVAVLGAVLTNQMESRFADAFGDASGSSAGAIAQGGSISPDAIQALPSAVQGQVQLVVANSIDVVFLVACGVLAVAFLVALALPGHDLDDEANVHLGEGEASHASMDD